jgi:hypothetical protein
MDKSRLIGIVITFLILISVLGYSVMRTIEIKDDLKICQELGYDGIKFVNSFSTKVECSNFSDLERESKVQNG